MPRRRRRKSSLVRRLTLALLAIPMLYLLAALIGTLIPVNRHWTEPDRGVTVYLASNGVHADLILPVAAAGVDWRPLLSRSDVAAAPPSAQWIAFGAGERQIYLNTPTWADLKLPIAARALTRGERIMHVEWVADPSFAQREIRLRPEEYRRLWGAIRASFSDGRPQRIAHKGYGAADAFYLGMGKASALSTCNNWVADQLRLAGVKAPLWSPFVGGLMWRYRVVNSSPS